LNSLNLGPGTPFIVDYQTKDQRKIKIWFVICIFRMCGI